MEGQVLNAALDNGIFAALFVLLFLYTIYDSRSREDGYVDVITSNQEIIKELSKKLNVVNDIQKNVCDIKNEIKRR